MFFKSKKSNLSQLTDDELIEKFVKNEDKFAFGEIYSRYAHLVYGLCFKYFKESEKSEDAVGAIFEKLMIDLKKNEIKHFKSWLYRVAQNYCLMALRSAKIHTEEISEKNEANFMDFSLLTHLDSEDEINQNKKLQEAISELKDEQKKCIELFFWENKSYSEIAEMTGFSPKDVKSYLQNGKRNIKKLLGFLLLIFKIGAL